MNLARISRPGACYVPSKAYNGYTLFAPLHGSGPWLIDMEGNLVHHWAVDGDPACHGVLLENGNLLYAGKTADSALPEIGPGGGDLLEIDWKGNVVWRYHDPYMHHDFKRLPNGNTMILRWVKTPDSIAKKIKGGIPGTEREGVIWSDSYQEITPDGKVVWEWLGYEHLDPETDAICPLCPRVEWTHINTCSLLPDGNVLACFIQQNTIAIIDKSTGNVKWRWGPGVLGHPHNPTFLENGNILVFDNGAHRPGPVNCVGITRVLEVNLDGEIVWEFMETSTLHFFSSHISGAQRLPNGNTFICEGTIGRFIEVTPEKEIVWEYSSPFYFRAHPLHGLGNNVFRAHRYGPDYPGLQGKNLDPERFELVLREKSKEKLRERRLAGLGY